jgi:hypothetical protein
VNTKKKPARQENSAAQVQKLAEQMRFRLKEAAAQRGNSQAFLHWIQTGSAKKA